MASTVTIKWTNLRTRTVTAVDEHGREVFAHNITMREGLTCSPNNAERLNAHAHRLGLRAAAKFGFSLQR